MQTPDSIVVGAGVIGLTVAWRLAEHGLQVAVLDAEPARGASWAAAGMLAPVTELHFGEEPLLDLNLAAARVWPDHAGQLAAAGVDVGFHACGSVMVARDADDAAALRRVMGVQQDLGMAVEWVRSRDLRELEPGLAPSTRGGVLVEGDHQVDNRALVDGLLSLCDAHPRVTLLRAMARSVEEDPHGTVHVTSEEGRGLSAPSVVIAAGARTPEVKGLHGLGPVSPVKGQLLHLQSPTGPLATRNIRGEDCYIVNRPDGRILVGATMEEQGFDDRPTAGGVRALLDAAWELLPGISEATFREVVVGFRPGSPDSGPLLGPLPDQPGIIIATGHHRNGVLQSRLTADAVLGWVTGAAVTGVATGFPPDRGRDVT